MEWTSVNNRLPDANNQYLCFVDEPVNGATYIGKQPRRKYQIIVTYVVSPRMIGEGNLVPYWYFEYSQRDVHKHITHWMPLPEQPSQEPKD